VLKVCRTPGPTACLKMLSKVCLKSWRKRKNSMTGPAHSQASGKMRVFWKKNCKRFFLVKKGSSSKNLDITYHTRLFKRNSKIFVLLQLKDTWVMAIFFLHHVKAFVCNQFFFTDFVAIHGEGGWYRLPGNRYPCSRWTRWCKLQLCVTFHL